ncbi:MAG: hypothetical protein WCA50_19225 [Candidatus Sulfotelmatobacter sp.]
MTAIGGRPKESLESRLAILEVRVAELEEAVDRVSGVMPPHFQKALNSISEKKPGPLERIDETELLLNRDNIVTLVEDHWPKIVKPLLAAKDPFAVEAVLKQVIMTPDSEWQHQFVQHSGALLDFLQSGKFRIKPPKKTVIDALRSSDSEQRRAAANRLPTRQIANAMAGVPRLKWRTSLDKCSQRPSSYRVGGNTAEHFCAMFGVPKGT